MKLYGFRRRIGYLMAFLVLSVPFGAILSGMVPSASIIPEVSAQPWVQPPTTWMNVTGATGSSRDWIFRAGYNPSPFTVNIEVSGVTDLFLWEFKLSWNASLLDVTSVTEGSFLSGAGTTTFFSQEFQDQAGLDYVLVNCTLLSGAGQSGSGVIATVDFDVDASATAGSTPLDLYETKMRDSSAGIISHGLTDGFVFMGDSQLYPLVYVLPQTVVADPGEMFNITLWIDNVESLQAWGFTLTWTIGMLDATNIVNHIFLEGLSGHIENFDNGNGRAVATTYLQGPQPGTYGSGPLATITFMVKQVGKSALDFDTDLVGIYYDPPNPIFTYPIPHGVLDGLFRSSKPVAAFTFMPQPPTTKPAAVNQTILFNATTSSDPGGLQIISYFWEFGDGVTATENDPITTHVYISPGESIPANLTVTNADGKSSETSFPVRVVVRDIAVTSVQVSHKTIMQNTLANVSVTVKNQGTGAENFLIEAYVRNQSTSTLLGTYNITLFTGGAVVTRYFVWNTTGYDFDDYTIQGIVPALIAENNVNNNEINVPIQVAAFNLIDYPAQYAGKVFHVLVLSNSTLFYPSPFQPTKFQYNSTAKEISFNVTGPTNAYAYVSVTVPKGLLNSDPLTDWVILLDGIAPPVRDISENATHTYLNLNFTLSEHKVQLIGTATGIPPTASFTVTPVKQFYSTGEILTLDASGSSDPDGLIATYFFDFDDGSNATGTAHYDGLGQLINVTWVFEQYKKTPIQFTTLTPAVAHNFTRTDLTDLTLNVNLTVTDNDGFPAGKVTQLKFFERYDVAISDLTISANPTYLTEISTVNVTVINKLFVDVRLRVNITIYGNNMLLNSTEAFFAPPVLLSLPVSFRLNSSDWGPGVYYLNATVKVVQYGDISLPDFPTEGASTLADNTRAYGYFTIKKYDSTLTVQVSSTSLTYGSPVIISGQLTPAMIDARITLESKLGSASFANLTTVSTRSGGQFQYLWTPTQAGTYDIRARFLGDAITASNISSTLAVVVRQVSSTVSIGVTPSSVSLGSSASIAGKIDPSRSSVQVTVYYRLSGGEWASLPATSTDAQGNYAVEWQPTETGTYEVQAKWAGDVNTVAAESEIAELTVQGDGGIPFYTWYIVIGIIVVAAVVVAVYFLKFRKTK